MKQPHITKITKNTGIRQHSTNSNLYAAVKLVKTYYFNSDSWVTKRTAIKRAKLMQKDIDNGLIKVY